MKRHRVFSILFMVFFYLCPLPAYQLESYNCRSNELKHITGNIPEQDLTLDWYIQESTNFRIIFPQQLETSVDFILREAENIYSMLSQWTHFVPEKKIDILLTNRSDYANGFVSPSTRGLFITLYMVYPYSSSSNGLDAYKNWYRNLLIHELSHVFHINIVRGGPAAFRKVFGNICYPNAYTPPFYLEGFAAYSETVNESGYGRGNSPYTRMYIRTAIEENNYIFLDRAANSEMIWPLGQTKYLYGVSFVNYLSEQYGEENIVDFNLLSGSYPFFMWNIPFNKIYGKRMHKVWDEWVEKEETTARDELTQVRSQRVTTLDSLTDMRGYVFSACIHPDGKIIAYSIRPIEKLGGIYLYDLENRIERCIKKGYYVYNLCFSKDGKKLYYIRYDTRRNTYMENNIYEMDLSRGRERQLTRSGNIQGFAPLEGEGQFIACSSTHQGTELLLIEEDGIRDSRSRVGKSQSIVLLKESTDGPGKLPPVIEEPSLSPDGDTLAFTYKGNEGDRGIIISSLKDLKRGEKKFRRITGVHYCAYSPSWINSDEIAFIGDKNGIYNLYTIKISSGEMKRVTNVLSGVFEPDISSAGEVILKEYTSNGFRVSRTHINALEKPYFEEKEESEVFESKEENEEDQKQGTGSAINTYRPGRWLLPGYWLPFMSGNGVVLGLGIYTEGKDLLVRHVYSAGIFYDVLDDAFKSIFNYTYNTYPFSYFGRFYISQDIEKDEIDPDIALYPGFSYRLIKRNFIVQSEMGMIFEHPYYGLNLSFLTSTTKSSIKWLEPEKGLRFTQGIYMNTEGGNLFMVLNDYFSLYFRPLEIFFLNFQLQSKSGIGDIDGIIKSGLSSPYRFVPLNSVYTTGYPDIVSGRFVFDFKTIIGFPLFYPERGFRTLPLFFRGVSLNLFSESGVIAADESVNSFVVTDVVDFIRVPSQYIRSSLGSELNFDFLIGYRFPFAVQLGYVYTLDEEGTEGLYVLLKSDLHF